MEPTTENPLDIADRDEKKKISVWKQRLELEGIETSEENVFIAAACDEKGIAFLKGESPLNIRKNDSSCENDKECNLGENNMSNANGNYTVVVDGQKFSVQVAEGDADIQVTAVNGESAQASAPAISAQDESIKALLPGSVWKVVANPRQSVAEGDVILILESMKMQIDVIAPRGGVVKSINVATNDKVVEGQVVAVLG